jgi:hypothetical protein
MRWALGVCGVALAAVCLWSSAGCVAARRALVEPPRLFVNDEVVDTRAGVCGVDVDVATGPLPDDAVVLSRFHVTTSQPVPLAQVLDLLRAHAERRCAQGVRVLRAEAADGLDGVIAVEAVAYLLPLP